MAKQLDTEIKVGSFVSLGLVLLMLSIMVLGSSQNFFTKQNRYFVHFNTVEGLLPGAKVVLGGVNVGTVTEVDFDQKRQDIRVELGVLRKYAEWIRKDTSAE